MKLLKAATVIALTLCFTVGNAFAGTESVCPQEITNFEANGPDLEGYEGYCDSSVTGSGVIEFWMAQPANTPNGLQTIEITMKRTGPSYGDTYFSVCQGYCWGANAYDSDSAALTGSLVTYTLTFQSSAMSGGYTPDPTGANVSVNISSAEAWEIASVNWISTY